MQKKINRIISILLFFQLIFPGFALGATVYIDDTFSSTDKVDMAKTTASIDILNGWVTLSKKNLANSIILYPDNYDITTINNTAVETYQLNVSTMQLNVAHSTNGGLAEPISIAGRAGEYIVLDRGTQTACWYHYDGVGMVQNSIISISALVDPRAIDVMPGTFDFALLDQADLNWYNYDSIGMTKNNYLSFNLGSASNPVSLSLENGNFAYVVLDKSTNQIQYYYYNGSGMVLDSSKSIQMPGELNNPKSISVSKEGGLYLIVDGNAVKAYNFDGTNMIYNSRLSLAGLVNPLAVTIKPESYDYVVLDENAGSPLIKYFAFADSSMEEIPELQITGLASIGYSNDQLLMGKEVTASQSVSGLKILASVDLPAGTNISWEATVDGIVWKPITPGGDSVRFSTPGTHPNYRATLHTDDRSITPKILDVQLLDSSLTITSHADKSSYKAGEAMVLYADTEGSAERVEAIMWWADGNSFTSETDTDLVPALPTLNDLNTWHTRHNYPSNYDRVVIIPQDMPDGNYIIIMRAYNGSNETEDTITIQVTGSQFNGIMSEIGDQRYMPND